MKEIKNYKHIRRKPMLFGFSLTSFMIFAFISLGGLFTFVDGFSSTKLIIVAIVIVLAFIVCRYFLGENSLLNKFLHQKFPNEINDLTKK